MFSFYLIHLKLAKISYYNNVAYWQMLRNVPQLDIFSFFSATTVLIVLFVSLIFILHTYYLPKIASCLKFRKKIQAKQESKAKTLSTKEGLTEEPFLDLANNFIHEIEKTVKKLTQK